MKIRARRLWMQKNIKNKMNNGHDYCSISRTESNLARHFSSHFIYILRKRSELSLRSNKRRYQVLSHGKKIFMSYLTMKTLLRNLPLIKEVTILKGRFFYNFLMSLDVPLCVMKSIHFSNNGKQFSLNLEQQQEMVESRFVIN